MHNYLIMHEHMHYIVT